MVEIPAKALPIISRELRKKRPVHVHLNPEGQEGNAVIDAPCPGKELKEKIPARLRMSQDGSFTLQPEEMLSRKRGQNPFLQEEVGECPF